MNKESINFYPEEQVDNTTLKALKTQINTESSRNHNVGNSNYAKMPAGYQPGMSLQESRKLDYEKIIHVCQERINQIDEGYEF